MMVRTVITNSRRLQCWFCSVNHLVFLRYKACLNHKSTHTYPDQSSLYLSFCRSSRKGENMKVPSQMLPPKFQLYVAQAIKTVLIHVLHGLVFHELVKIGVHWCPTPFSPISQTKIWNAKLKTENEKLRVMALDGSRCAGRRVKKKGTETS